MGKIAKLTQACTSCGAHFSAEKSRCTSCGSWNVPKSANDGDDTVLLSDIDDEPVRVIKTGPWDPCFSGEGGIPVSAAILIGGSPGAGKTTLCFQLLDSIAAVEQREVLYIAKESAPKEMRNMASRLKLKNAKLIRLHPMGAVSDVGDIITRRRPCAIVCDSIQAMSNDLEFQVALAKRLKEYSVTYNMPSLIITHVTKADDFAGLNDLQHEVDTTISFFPELEDGMPTEIRLLSTMKNRFGPVPAFVELEMTERGLILGLARNEDEEE